MAEFKYDIKEIIAPLKESDKHDWIKAVSRISWNDGPSNIDIRNINMVNNKIGKGISITDEEADKLVDILLNEGFGSVEEIEKALKRKQCFKIEVDEMKNFFNENNEMLVIEID